MGLQYAYQVVDQTVATTSLETLPPRFTLVFDGLFFIYSCQSGTCELEVADRVVDIVKQHMHEVAKRAPHVRFATVFMLDGKAPLAKRHTQSKRSYPNLNMGQIKQRLREQMPHRGIQILELTEGEAEAEAMHQRKGPVVIVTNDSDMFHLAYRYPMRDARDQVIYAKRNFKALYDFSKPKIHVDRQIFKLLLFACGSDYSSSIVTRTMFQAIVSQHQVLELVRPVGPLDRGQVFTAILLFFKLAIEAPGSTCVLPRRKSGAPNTETDHLGAYIEILQWCVGYSNQGVQFAKYKAQLPYVELDIVAILCAKLQVPEPWTNANLKQRLTSLNTNALVQSLNAEPASETSTFATHVLEA